MKLILAVILTLLISGPIGIVVGYKMAEKQKYQLGERHGREEVLKQLYGDIRSQLGHSLSGQPGGGEDLAQATPGTQSLAMLYQIDGSYIHLVEIDGVRTLAVSQ